MPTRHLYVAHCFGAGPGGYVAVTHRQRWDV